MKITFVDFTPWNYSIGSVYEVPLGGSQSALCYLAMNLAQLGHDVFLVSYISAPQISFGVACLPLNCVAPEFWTQQDYIIILNNSGYGRYIKDHCQGHTNLILWTQHSYDQPGVQELRNEAEKNAYDFFFMVSEWQKGEFIREFLLPSEKILVFRNAIGKKFENLFDKQSPLFKQKSQLPILFYTSAPFRGLDLLLDIFPEIYKEFPDIKLNIYSSMKVYQTPGTEDYLNYGELYERCRKMPGVEYIGSLPQQQLAQELKEATILAYPNTFAETSCIAVMEAMASGCYVITSELGALPETTAGFGTLISFENGIASYKARFIEVILDILRKFKSDQKQAIEEELLAQIKFVNENYNWTKRAEEWSLKLYELMEEKLWQSENFWQAQKWYQEAIEKHPQVAEFYYHYILTSILCDDEESALSTLLYLSVPSELDVTKATLNECAWTTFFGGYIDQLDKKSLNPAYKKKIDSFLKKIN
ncbi:glycosyltransferase family 4 protein [Synechocystis sp. LKSZ1]|uniref:glycosyltransferase family 4 protein n=1 Tax=Synechocystis sp. LKSZ1 TaxID=3144951 RepID=UPI00336BBF7F